jgi:hypothetical protein
MNALLIAVLAVRAGAAAPQQGAPAAVPVRVSSAAAVPAAVAAPAPALPAPASLALGVSTYTIASLYTGDRVRDPFLPPAMGSGRKRAEDGSTEPVDIHSLQLRGILNDAATDFAVFSSDFGTTLILRGGRLYDERSRVVPGITGRIKPKQKRVELITTDRDVQVFRLGETEPGEDKGKF